MKKNSVNSNFFKLRKIFFLFIAINLNNNTVSTNELSLKVMTFNIRGASKEETNTVDSLVKAIKTVNADIIGLQETRRYNNDNCTYSKEPAKSCPPTGKNYAQLIAQDLGYHYYEQTKVNSALWANAIISKYPIEKVTQNDLGVSISVDDNKFYLFNIHLTDYPNQVAELMHIKYGPAPFLDTAKQARNSAKNARGSALKLLFNDLEETQGARAIFIIGDFNEPSWLDWTKRAARLDQQPLRVRWPSTYKLKKNGFNDVLRAIHPNEITKPAFTWPTIELANLFTHKDRIDFIFIKSNNFKIYSTEVVGEKHPEADIVIEPWTSDHRAIVTKLIFY